MVDLRSGWRIGSFPERPAVTYRRARILAAERGTSLSALVRSYLESLGSGETEADRLRRLERELRARIIRFCASDRVPRDELHERHRS